MNNIDFDELNEIRIDLQSLASLLLYVAGEQISVSTREGNSNGTKAYYLEATAPNFVFLAKTLTDTIKKLSEILDQYQ